MEITLGQTTNESERKFQTSSPISKRQKSYEDANSALMSPVANKIFGFPWTQAVSVGPDYVTITKQDWVDWSVLEEPLKGLLEEHFSEAKGEIEENPELVLSKAPALDSDEAKIIQSLIEEQINPALSSHGGYVVLHSVENNQVFLEMGGGCQGCAMSYQTLKEGIETSIRAAVPSITQVIDVTNHAQGDKPFYS
jgi:Fe-S cluster biogenesis protein NfuA